MKRVWMATLTLVWVVSLGCGQNEPAVMPETDPEAESAAEAVADDEAAAFAAADAEAERQAATDRTEIRQKAVGIFQSLPDVAASEMNPITPEKVTLGKALYFDSRLSKNHDVSCNSCHGLTTYGVDNEPTSPGHKGQRGDRNSPTVYNAAFHVAQFWDGRADDVEAQAKGPVLNPIEMAMPSEAATVAVLDSIPGYAPLFAAAFPNEEKPITYDNMARAIGAFERTLVTPSRFDAFLEGADDALSDEEFVGLDNFINTGCISCHMGPTMGGSMFQKLGTVLPYETEDPGRFNVTQNEIDRGVFKVPSLRNIEMTGPWFHDGSITDLDQAIRLMARHQLGKELSNTDVASIRAFLATLTAELDAEVMAVPTLPESGPNTPAPDPS